MLVRIVGSRHKLPTMVGGSEIETGGVADALGEHRLAFAERFGDAAGARLFFAPGRVNLMGAHLDYNGGPVMPMTVRAGTFLAVRPRTDRSLHLASTVGPESATLDLDRLPEAPSGSWVDYPLGVVRGLAARHRTAGAPSGLDVLFGGNLPIGAGLSSSASICVGTAYALDAVWALGLEPGERVDVALHAEREFVGVRCGIMDPFAVGYARPSHLLWLDCKDESIEHLPLDTRRVRIAVVDTNVRRQLAQSAFNQRVEECRLAFEMLAPHAVGATCLRDVPLDVLDAHAAELPPPIQRRARHVVEEVARTFAARAALMRGDLFTFGAQMSAAHRSLAEKFEVSVPELDCVVEAAQAWDGVYGARLTGAGFGGCAVVLLARDADDGFAEWIARSFERRFRATPVVRFFDGDPGPREVT